MTRTTEQMPYGAAMIALMRKGRSLPEDLLQLKSDMPAVFEALWKTMVDQRLKASEGMRGISCHDYFLNDTRKLKTPLVQALLVALNLHRLAGAKQVEQQEQISDADGEEAEEEGGDEESSDAAADGEAEESEEEESSDAAAESGDEEEDTESDEESSEEEELKTTAPPSSPKEFKKPLRLLLLSAIFERHSDVGKAAMLKLQEKDQNAQKQVVYEQFHQDWNATKKQVFTWKLPQIQDKIMSSQALQDRTKLFAELQTDQPDRASKSMLLSIIWNSYMAAEPWKTLEDLPLKTSSGGIKRKFADTFPADDDHTGEADVPEFLTDFVQKLTARIVEITPKQIQFFVDALKSKKQIQEPVEGSAAPDPLEMLTKAHLTWLARKDKDWKYFYGEDKSKAKHFKKKDLELFKQTFNSAY